MTIVHTAAGTQRPPRVSVLITTYNGAEFITETVSSVLGQSFRDFELVVVDDGSTDETLAALAGFTDPRLHVLRTPRNLGVVGARNFGYRALRGDYVATLDHDDLWQPTRLEEGVAILDAQPATNLVATQCAPLRKGQILKTDRLGSLTPMLLRWLLLMRCSLVYSSLLFRRTASQLPEGGFLRPDLRYADDYELMLRLSLQADGRVIDAPLTLYRVHDRNTTWVVHPEMMRNSVAVLAEVYARWVGHEAGAAARLMNRHATLGQPPTSSRELEAFAAALFRLLDGFLATYQPGHDDRRQVTENAKDAYWRVARAGIRSGRIWLAGSYLRHPSLVNFRRLPADLIVSLAAGLVRLAFRPGRMRRHAVAGGE